MALAVLVEPVFVGQEPRYEVFLVTVRTIRCKEEGKSGAINPLSSSNRRRNRRSSTSAFPKRLACGVYIGDNRASRWTPIVRVDARVDAHRPPHLSEDYVIVGFVVRENNSHD